VTRGAARAAIRALAAALILVAVVAAPVRARPAAAPTATTVQPAAPASRRRPAGPPIVGILELRVDGVSPTVAERFEAAIEDGLGSAELRIATRTRLREMLAGSTWSEGCLFGPCLAEVLRQTGVDRVVVAYFQGRGSSYRFVVSLVDTASGRIRAQAAERCEVCTLSEALDGAVLATIGLIHGASPGGSVASGPAQRPPPIAPPRRGARRALRRSALLLVGVAALAGGAGAYFVGRDRDRPGYAALGSSGALAATGGLMFGLSFSLD
jgi:hypothetical protein